MLLIIVFNLFRALIVILFILQHDTLELFLSATVDVIFLLLALFGLDSLVIDPLLLSLLLLPYKINTSILHQSQTC